MVHVVTTEAYIYMLKSKKIILIGTISMIVLLFFFFALQNSFFQLDKTIDYVEPNTISNYDVPVETKDRFKAQSNDYIADLERDNVLIQEIKNLILEKNFVQVIAVAQKLYESATNYEEQAYAELAIADSYLLLGQLEKAIILYFKIFNNDLYESYTRVAALNAILGNYKGTNASKSLVLLYPELEGKPRADIEFFVLERMYDVQPTAHSASAVGIAKLDKLPSVDAHFTELYSKFLDEIDDDIRIQSLGVASQKNIPGAYAAKARFLAHSYFAYNYGDSSIITESYEKAVNKSRELSNQISEQFMLLQYVNFLGLNSEFVKAEKIFVLFSVQITTAMVRQNLSSESLSSMWPGIFSLSQNVPSVKKYFIDNAFPL